MRLPVFLTGLSPVGETLTAMERGQACLEEETAKRNRQLSVSTAEEGLTLWEADYSLPDNSGAKTADRRARIRAALAGSRTLTRDWMKALCVSVGGADDAEVEEDFPNWHVSVTAFYTNGAPEDLTMLEKAVRQLQPAHLHLDVAAEGLLRSDQNRYLALSGNAFFVFTGREGA